MTQKLKFLLWRVENIVGKGGNAAYQHFLLFPQYFQKLSFGLNIMNHELHWSFDFQKPFNNVSLPKLTWVGTLCKPQFVRTCLVFIYVQVGYKEKDVSDSEKSDKDCRAERSKSPVGIPKGKKRKLNGTGSGSEDSNDGLGRASFCICFLLS